MRRLLPLALGSLALAAVPARAATIDVIRGAGFGHGVGMSQYGAYGLARHGASYRAILAHYYRGTVVSTAGQRSIRVLLQAGRASISFTGATHVPDHRLDPNRTYRARQYGVNRVELRNGRNKLVGRFDAPLVATSSRGYVQLRGTALNGITDGNYRGALQIRPGTFGGLLAVNSLPLDQYAEGVLPGEMPASWHRQALQAQAVATRSYALATDRGGALFDQYPDTRSQVYRGMSGEDPRSNAAVQATAGQVLRYRGRVAVTYFFSASGGRTENVENVFYGSRPVPYLVGVKDPYDSISPRHRWRFRFTHAQMQARLSGLVRGRFRGITVVKRGVSPRVVWADVRGSRGRTRVRGATLGARLGLYDTWAYFTTVSSSAKTSATPRPAPRAATAAGVLRWVLNVLDRPAPRRVLHGRVAPRPRAGRLLVQRRAERGWRTTRRVRTRRDGRYRVSLRSAGTYRVLAAGVAGPATRVR